MARLQETMTITIKAKLHAPSSARKQIARFLLWIVSKMLTFRVEMST